MKLKSSAFGLATGITFGIAFFLASLWIYINIKGGGGTGEMIRKFDRFFFGYDPHKFIGLLVGFFWAFIYSYVIGSVFAGLYNALCGNGQKAIEEEGSQEQE